MMCRVFKQPLSLDWGFTVAENKYTKDEIKLLEAAGLCRRDRAARTLTFCEILIGGRHTYPCQESDITRLPTNVLLFLAFLAATNVQVCRGIDGSVKFSTRWCL